jgi:hypothetical protein
MLCNNILCPTSKSRILDTVIKKHTQAVDVHPPTGSLVAPEFVKIEKNLNTLGFFTPAKHKGQKSREKIITMRRELGGKVVEAQAVILPSAKYGLPTAADLDKYLAFHKLVENIRIRSGQILNPVRFTSAQLMNILGMRNSGNNYQDIAEWLQRMTATTINSKGTVYLAKRKAWMSDTFHVFDRIVTMGSALPDGTVADQHYVWLSEWQIENINSNYLLPIDIDTYRQLKNQIAKILVPLLQVWLYATRAEGRFEKRYTDLCQILDIANHKPLSLIRRQLEPSLAELTHHGYLASWAIAPTADGREYKLVATHGHKFYRDQKIRMIGPSTQCEGKELSLLKELTTRGINEPFARRLLRQIPEDQPIIDQLEWGDYTVSNSKSITNPPGFYVYLLKENIRPPDAFETSSKRRQRQLEENDQREEHIRRVTLENRYHDFCEEQTHSYLLQMPPEIRTERLAGKLRLVRKQWGHLPKDAIEQIAMRQLENEVRDELALPSLEEFADRDPQQSLFN